MQHTEFLEKIVNTRRLNECFNIDYSEFGDNFRKAADEGYISVLYMNADTNKVEIKVLHHYRHPALDFAAFYFGEFNGR